MPYIKKADRDKFAPALESLPSPQNAGELNYLFTVLIQRYIAFSGGENYQRYNDAIGALEGAKLELYRRRTAPYEDKKITENGDV